MLGMLVKTSMRGMWDFFLRHKKGIYTGGVLLHACLKHEGNDESGNKQEAFSHCTGSKQRQGQELKQLNYTRWASRVKAPRGEKRKKKHPCQKKPQTPV